MDSGLAVLCNNIKRYIYRRAAIDRNDFLYLIRRIYHPPKNNDEYIDVLMFMMKNLVPRVFVHEWYCRTNNNTDDNIVMSRYLVPALADKFLDVREGTKSVQSPRQQYLQWLYFPIDCDDSSVEGGDPKPTCPESQAPNVNFNDDRDRFLIGDTYSFIYEVVQDTDADYQLETYTYPIDDPELKNYHIPIRVFNNNWSDEYTFSAEPYLPGEYMYVVEATNCAGTRVVSYPFELYDIDVRIDICMDQQYVANQQYPYQVKVIQGGREVQNSDQIDEIKVYLSVIDDETGVVSRYLIGEAVSGILDFQDFPALFGPAGLMKRGQYFIDTEVNGVGFYKYALGSLPSNVSVIDFQIIGDIEFDIDSDEFIRTEERTWLADTLLTSHRTVTIMPSTRCSDTPICLTGFVPVGSGIEAHVARFRLDPSDYYRDFAEVDFRSAIGMVQRQYEAGDELVAFSIRDYVPNIILDDYNNIFDLQMKYNVVKVSPAVVSAFTPPDVVNSFLRLTPTFEIFLPDGTTLDNNSDPCAFGENNICLCIEFSIYDVTGTIVYFYSGEYKPVCGAIPKVEGENVFSLFADFAKILDENGDVVKNTEVVVEQKVKFTFCNDVECNMTNALWTRRYSHYTTPDINYEYPIIQGSPLFEPEVLPPEEMTYVRNSRPGSTIKFSIDKKYLIPDYSYKDESSQEFTIGDTIVLDSLPPGDHVFTIRAVTDDGVGVFQEYTIHVVEKPQISIVNQVDPVLYNNDPGDPHVSVIGGPVSYVPFVTVDEPITADITYDTQRSCFQPVLDYINGLRAASGLQPLQFQDNLFKAAYEHSLDMDFNNFVTHQSSPTSKTPGGFVTDRTKLFGYYDPANLGEAVWFFEGGCQNAIDAWNIMDAGHKAMFFASKYKDIGIAFVGNRWTWVVGSGVYNKKPAPPLIAADVPMYTDSIDISTLPPGEYTARGYVLISGIKYPLDPLPFEVFIKIDISVINFTPPFTWYYDKLDPMNPFLSVSHSWRNDATVKLFENSIELTDLHISNLAYGVHTVNATVSYGDKTYSSTPFKFLVGLEVEDVIVSPQLLDIFNASMRPLSMSFSVTQRNLLSDVSDLSSTSKFSYTSRDVAYRFRIPVFSLGAKDAGVSGPVLAHYMKNINPNLSTATSPNNNQAFFLLVYTQTYVDGQAIRISDGNFQGHTGASYKSMVTNGDGTSKELRVDIDTTAIALSSGWNFMITGGFNEVFNHPRFPTQPNWQVALYKFRSTFPKGVRMKVIKYNEMEQYVPVTNVISTYIETRSTVFSSQPTTDVTPTLYDTYDGIVRVRQVDIIKYPSVIPFAFCIFNENFTFCTSNGAPGNFNLPTQFNLLSPNGQTYFYFKNIIAVAFFEAIPL